MPGPSTQQRYAWDDVLASLLPPGARPEDVVQTMPDVAEPLPPGMTPRDFASTMPDDARPLPPGATPRDFTTPLDGAQPPRPPPPAAAPTPQLPAEPESDPVEDIIQSALAPQQVQQLAPAPQRPPPPDGMGEADWTMFLSVLLDQALNKGRGGGQIMKYYADAPDRELDRAHKQAEIDKMYAQLNPQAAPPGDQIARGNLALRGLGMQRDAKKAEESAALTKRKGDIGSPETKSAQDALIAIGYPEPEARKLTAAQIEMMRPQLGTEVAQGRSHGFISERQAEADRLQRRRMRIAEGYDIAGEERGEERTLRTEGREEERRADANDIPGYRQVKRVADQDARDARGFAAAIDDVEEYAKRLEQLQAQIGARGLQGPLANITDPEAADALAEARLLQINLDGAIRKLQNWGVPQEYELELLKRANPPADSWRGVLEGGRAYRMQAKIASEKARRQMKTYGYEADNGERRPKPKSAPSGRAPKPGAAPGALSFDPNDPLGGL